VDKLTSENNKLHAEVEAAKAQLRDIKAKAGRREWRKTDRQADRQ
jgi:hypothetical protein